MHPNIVEVSYDVFLNRMHILPLKVDGLGWSCARPFEEKVQKDHCTWISYIFGMFMDGFLSGLLGYGKGYFEFSSMEMIEYFPYF